MKGISQFSTFMMLFIIGTSNSIYAQVTMGSKIEPAKASILDLKTQAPDGNNQTSTTGGIVMPRVKLVDINTLEPFIDKVDPDIETLKKSHTGLTVYNLSQTTPFSQGLYIWDGTKWMRDNSASGSTILSVVNGLNLYNGDVKLGGTLNEATIVDQSSYNMSFTTGNTGTWSVNNADFNINENGYVGIGTETPTVNLDINGNTASDGKITVAGNTVLKGETTVDGTFTYSKDAANNKYLMSTDNNGTAEWVTITTGENSIIPGVRSGTNVTTPSNNTTQYVSTTNYIDLTPGRWLVKMSTLLRASSITSNTRTKIWIKTGLVRNSSGGTTGSTYDSYDKYRDRSNTAYPVYIESIVDTKYQFTIVTGDIVIDTDVSGRFYLAIIKDELRPDASFNWATGTAIQLNRNASENAIIAFPLN